MIAYEIAIMGSDNKISPVPLDHRRVWGPQSRRSVRLSREFTRKTRDTVNKFLQHRFPVGSATTTPPLYIEFVAENEVDETRPDTDFDLFLQEDHPETWEDAAEGLREIMHEVLGVPRSRLPTPDVLLTGLLLRDVLYRDEENEFVDPEIERRVCTRPDGTLDLVDGPDLLRRLGSSDRRVESGCLPLLDLPELCSATQRLPCFSRR